MGLRELCVTEIEDDFLQGFERYETVERAWRRVKPSDQWQLQRVSYIEHWDEAALRRLCAELRETLEGGGAVCAAIDEATGLVAGFASIEGRLMGEGGQLYQLSNLHISRPYRGRGLGKQLFDWSVSEALHRGGAGLYISASSCEATQAFYAKLGCVHALMPDERLSALEPYDVQLVYWGVRQNRG